MKVHNFRFISDSFYTFVENLRGYEWVASL